MKKQLAATLGLAMVTGGIIIATSGPAQADDLNTEIEKVKSVATSGPAQADDLNTEIEKVKSVATMLSRLVTAFTTVLVTPMGISAAIKVFKTLVLFNL